MATIASAHPSTSGTQPSVMPTNKTIAATSGSAIASAIAILVIYFVENHSGTSTPLRADVASALTALITALVTFVAGYLTPYGANETILRTANGNVVAARH